MCMSMTIRMPKLSRDGVKHAALWAMLVNHAAQTFCQRGSVLFWILVYIGYITAPVMCWFLVEGFYHTRSRKNYAFRLFVFAVLTQPVYHIWMLSSDTEPGELNMLFQLLICFFILTVRNLRVNILIRLFLEILLIGLSTFATWYVFVPLEVILFDRAYHASQKDPENARKIGAAAFAVAALIVQISALGSTELTPTALLSSLAVIVAGILVLYCHDGSRDNVAKRGWFQRYYFYAFYPVHLAIIALIKFVIVR